jgi:serine/threonine protein kinase
MSTTGTGTSNSATNKDINVSTTDDRDWSMKEDEWKTTVGEGLAYNEDHFLTSANLCRWIINFEDIQIGQQVGMGSYGVVYQGKWKGVSVAVKRFIKQKLDERRMLEFRAEMAFLSQLHHPNIVLFIGTRPTCVWGEGERHYSGGTLTRWGVWVCVCVVQAPA